MHPKREREKLGRERLMYIIDNCRAIEERSLDPFQVDIDTSINQVKEYFPDWSIPEDLCLDAETVHRIASVVKLQGDWVKHRTTSLYTDPFLLEEKLMRLPKEQIVQAFTQAWHPVVEMEQISLHSLAEAITYWMNLLPINERWNQLLPEPVQAGSATREELLAERILSDKAFSEELEGFWQELRNHIQERSNDGKIRYWDFVGAESYRETVQRAFLTSFLITYGYATLEIHPLEEEMFIKPFDKPRINLVGEQLVSVPIAISMKDWTMWKNGRIE